MSDQIAIQLISSAVTLIALYFHSRQGSKENKAISVSINGDRQIMIEKMNSMEREILRLTGSNATLNEQANPRLSPPPTK